MLRIEINKNFSIGVAIPPEDESLEDPSELGGDTGPAVLVHPKNSCTAGMEKSLI